MGARGETGVRPVGEYVVKVASRCDLACDHCYVYDDPQQAWSRQPARMAPEVAQLVATRIAEHAHRHGLERVAVILHGGEPLLLGQERLLAVLGVLRSTIDPVTTLDLRLQSNGTLLTPALCETLVRHGASVGVSLDGDRLANDRHRLYANGRSSHSRVLRGLDLLRRPEFRSAYSGLLCTVDVDNDPVRVYEALLRESPPRIDFLLPHATWDRPPPGRSYAEWLLRIHDRWEADGRPVSIRLFESIESLERGGPSGTESLGVDNPTVAVIETDGTWELPDSLKTVSGDAPYTGLDLRHHSADDFLRHLGARRHGATPTACTTCPLVTTCGGGLYAHRFGRGNGFDNPSVYCAELARLIVGMRYRRRAAGRLLGDAADPVAPEPVDGLVRREHEVDLELMFTVATMAGKDHGRPAWQLLVDVEAASPETVVSTLAHPYVRLRVREALAAAQPDGAVACRDVLAAAAMAAAIRAGYPGSLDVPAVAGVLCLPGLGVLALPEASVAQVSSSAAPGEFAVRPDVGRSWTSASPGSARWRPAGHADTDGSGPRFDDVDPAPGCAAHPVAEQLSSGEQDARVAMLEPARPSELSVAPEDAAFGAVAIPMAEPAATAVALAGHTARSVFVADADAVVAALRVRLDHGDAIR